MGMTMPDRLDRMKSSFLAEGPVTAETRLDRIDRCLAILVDHQEQICDAIEQDFGCRSKHVTTMSDIYASVKTLKFVKKELKKWMKPEKRRPPFPLALFGAKATLYYQPKGVVGIMAPWNFPVNMIFSPLADVLAAGNRAMIKPSEFTPATSDLMQVLFRKYFSEDEICVVTGDATVGSEFASLPLDHIIFTGATSVGKLVMRAASDNLVPVTLELGGKSPVFISETAEVEDVAAKLMLGKAMNAGQICVSPDYCFIPESMLEGFVQACKNVIALHYPTVVENPDFVAVINERHFHRISTYISEARQAGIRVEELNPAAEEWDNSKVHKVPLHLIIEPTDNLKCMQDEIFGPILNVKTYRNFNDAVSYVQKRPKPLAMYYFGKSESELGSLLERTSAGGMTVNDVTMHVACDDMPFGGVGASGMGHYHGFEGFKTFSHAKGVYTQGWVNLGKLGGTLPPYGEKFEQSMAKQISK